ncbi:MAG: HslU--HslV peptidase proteolytic subunit [Deltaproteobacteria bacterium CG2_30_63_29]|nr:MAG: HslU--HslV peptidase proteolytic subunit [Deltaproteobacteria bacterium CG2_30_63_29]PJB34970.1 MAG: HslU--HslV peptidase proteolytic subunit [Deltaproteobacteria bacterium CG_4_9_14_3_um_filter_63_12]
MTTIVGVRHKGRVVIVGDGQVSMGNTIMKATAAKVRSISSNRVIVGFAGSTADAMTLFEKLEAKLAEYGGNLLRAAVELAKDWRTDKYLRRLEALMIAADRSTTLLISGTGDVISPDEGVIAIGSGGNYALAAARALLRNTDLSAREIAEAAIGIAAEICVFTNDNLTIEEMESAD